MMDLLRLFRRGPGRRRLPAAYAEVVAQLAELAPVANLVRYPCPQLGHPAQWSTEPAGDCPWCIAETYADEAADLEARLLRFEADERNATAVDVPCVADLPGSCFAEPDPAPAEETELRITDIPPGPVDCEAASVTERTQAVDVRELRRQMAESEDGSPEGGDPGTTSQWPVIPGAEDDTRPIATVRQLADLATTP